MIVDEFFGGGGTRIGGLGFLARNFVAKYIPDEDIEIDVLLGRSRGSKLIPKQFHVDNVTLYKLPHEESSAKEFLKNQNYDIYLSIELRSDYVMLCESDMNKKLILWIQDPRPNSEWEYINTLKSIKEGRYPDCSNICDVTNKWAAKNRVIFVSQGYCLNSLAMELYNCPQNTSIQYLPNPVDIDFNFRFNISEKKRQVMFLGRLVAPKRAWLFCEVAKRMPEYNFIVVGKILEGRHKKDNERMLKPYLNGSVPNLQFLGHIEGEEKKRLLKVSRMMLSTSIHEGISISWLEALSYGTPIVSNLERDGIVERFGGKAPDLPGDGFDGVDSFVPIIRNLMENDEIYELKAKAAIEYVRKTHNIPRFTKDLRDLIKRNVGGKENIRNIKQVEV